LKGKITFDEQEMYLLLSALIDLCLWWDL